MESEEREPKYRKRIILTILIIILIIIIILLLLRRCGSGSSSNYSVVGITAQPLELNLDVGESAQIYAQVEPSDAKNQRYSCSSADITIATVDSECLVTGVGIGETTILVISDDGGKTVTVPVIVGGKEVKLTGIEFDPSSYTVNVGRSTLVTVKAVPEGAKLPDLFYEVVDSNIADYSGNGKITGKKVGTTKIKAKSSDGFVTEAEIIVTKKTYTSKTCKSNEVLKDGKCVPVTGNPTTLLLTEPTKTIYVGETYKPGFQIFPIEASQAITCKISEAGQNILGENNCVLTGIRAGTVGVEVCAKADSKLCSTLVITVKDKQNSGTKSGGTTVITSSTPIEEEKPVSKAPTCTVTLNPGTVKVGETVKVVFKCENVTDGVALVNVSNGLGESHYTNASYTNSVAGPVVIVVYVTGISTGTSYVYLQEGSYKNSIGSNNRVSAKITVTEVTKYDYKCNMNYDKSTSKVTLAPTSTNSKATVKSKTINGTSTSSVTVSKTPGTYTYTGKATFSDGGSCEQTISVTIEEVETKKTTYTYTCNMTYDEQNKKVTLTPTSTNKDAKVKTTSINDVSGSTMSVTKSGDYVGKATFSDGGSCEKTLKIELKEAPSGKVTYTCNISKYQNIVTITGTASNGSPVDWIGWDDGYAELREDIEKDGQLIGAKLAILTSNAEKDFVIPIYFEDGGTCNGKIRITSFDIPTSNVTHTCKLTKNKNVITLTATASNGEGVWCSEISGGGVETSNETLTVTKPGTYTGKVWFQDNGYAVCHVQVEETDIPKDSNEVACTISKNKNVITLTGPASASIDHLSKLNFFTRENVGNTYVNNNTIKIAITNIGTYNFRLNFKDGKWCDKSIIIDKSDISVSDVNNSKVTCELTKDKNIITVTGTSSIGAEVAYSTVSIGGRIANRETIMKDGKKIGVRFEALDIHKYSVDLEFLDGNHSCTKSIAITEEDLKAAGISVHKCDYSKTDNVLRFTTDDRANVKSVSISVGSTDGAWVSKNVYEATATREGWAYLNVTFKEGTLCTKSIFISDSDLVKAGLSYKCNISKNKNVVTMTVEDSEAIKKIEKVRDLFGHTVEKVKDGVYEVKITEISEDEGSETVRIRVEFNDGLQCDDAIEVYSSDLPSSGKTTYTCKLSAVKNILTISGTASNGSSVTSSTITGGGTNISGSTYTATKAGTYTGKVWFKDGHVETCNSVYISQDVIPELGEPDCSTVAGDSMTWTNKDRTITITCNTCQQRTYTKTFTETTKKATIDIVGKNGKKQACKINVYVDKEAPSVDAISSNANSSSGAGATLCYFENIEESGVKRVSGDYACTSGWCSGTICQKFTGLKSNKTVNICDNAGNCTSETIKVTSRTITGCPTINGVKYYTIYPLDPTNQTCYAKSGDSLTYTSWSSSTKTVSSCTATKTELREVTCTSVGNSSACMAAVGTSSCYYQTTKTRSKTCPSGQTQYNGECYLRSSSGTQTVYTADVTGISGYSN